MSENPYQSPMAELDVGGQGYTREDLRSLARYQKGLLVCIALYVIGLLIDLVMPPGIRGFVGLGVFAVVLAGTAIVFLLATKAYSPAVGILWGVLVLIPCVGLLVLLTINGKATRLLKQNGIRVGLMGAKLSEI